MLAGDRVDIEVPGECRLHADLTHGPAAAIKARGELAILDLHDERHNRLPVRATSRQRCGAHLGGLDTIDAPLVDTDHGSTSRVAEREVGRVSGVVAADQLELAAI